MKRSNLSQDNLLCLLWYCLAIAVVFKFVFRNFLGSIFDYGLVGSSFLFVFAVFSRKINFHSLLVSGILLAFFARSLISLGVNAPMYFVAGFSSVILTAMLGISSLHLHLHLHLNLRRRKRGLRNFLVFASVLNSLSILIYIFVDRSIFGLIPETIYSDLLRMEDGHISLRAYSLIGSSQANGYLQFLFFVFLTRSGIALFPRSGLLLLVLFAGFLTGSRSFIFLLLLFYSVYWMINFGAMIKALGLVFTLSVIMVFSQIGDLVIFERLQATSQNLSVMRLNPTVDAWLRVVLLDRSFWSYVLGEGLGVLSRAGQALGGNRYPFSTSESFLLQIWFEMGFLGVALLFIWYAQFAWKFITNRAHLALLVTTFFSQFTTPAFYGSSVSLLFLMVVIFIFMSSDELKYSRKIEHSAKLYTATQLNSA